MNCPQINGALRCERLNTQERPCWLLLWLVSDCSGTYTALQCYNCDLLCKIALMKHSPLFLVSECKKPVLCSACVCEQQTDCYGIVTVLLLCYRDCCHLPMCRPHSVRHVTHTCQVEYIEFCATLSRRNLTCIIYIYIFIYLFIYLYIQDVPGGMCQTSGGCSLC